MYLVKLLVKEEDLEKYKENLNFISQKKIKTEGVDIYTCNNIISIVVKYMGINFKDFKNLNRGVISVSESRHLARYFIRKYTSLSLQNIGEKTGFKDHASVISSLKTVKSLTDKKFGDKKFKVKFNYIDKVLSDFYGY